MEDRLNLARYNAVLYKSHISFLNDVHANNAALHQCTVAIRIWKLTIDWFKMKTFQILDQIVEISEPVRIYVKFCYGEFTTIWVDDNLRINNV